MKKLIFERQSVYEEHAKLLGTKLEEHVGYFRENNGDWVIVDEDGDRVGTVSFKGKAKRGEAWQAPDPEGMAIARRIVQSFNESLAKV